MRYKTDCVHFYWRDRWNNERLGCISRIYADWKYTTVRDDVTCPNCQNSRVFLGPKKKQTPLERLIKSLEQKPGKMQEIEAILDPDELETLRAIRSILHQKVAS